MRRFATACLIAISVLPGRATAQTCNEPHYRWSEKTTLSLVALTPIRATISQMLTRWPLPAIYGATDKCTDRTGRELQNYYVIGWVRRRKAEADGDWHIELTATKTMSVPNNCIVVEIPPVSAGAQYQAARNQFDALITAAGATYSSAGDLAPPVRVKIVGAAFFDGEHRGAQGTPKPPHQHGRCNRDSRSLWEIHPVYGAYAP